MSEWIDFKELKKKLSFETVLVHYGIKVKHGKGNHHQGTCPLPMHTGSRKHPSFTAKLDHGVFRCFACGASGDAIRFATLMEGLNPDNPQELRSIAIKLRDTFGITADTRSHRDVLQTHSKSSSSRTDQMPVVINPPLDFELKNLDPDHPSLTGRGLYPETIRTFGLGYCSRGYFSGRIAIPLHDAEAKLIGYAGEHIGEERVNEEMGSLLFPEDRERDGKRIRFDRTRFLYNASRQIFPVKDDLIIVTEIQSVWWLTQCGYPDTVSIMGSSCSDEQLHILRQLVRNDMRVWLFAGEQDGPIGKILVRIGTHRFVRWVKPPGEFVTECTPGDLSKLLWSV